MGLNQMQYFAILSRANAAISFAESGNAEKTNEQYGKLIDLLSSLVDQ